VTATCALPAVAITPVGAAGIVVVLPLPPELPLPDPFPLPLPEVDPEPVPVVVVPLLIPPAQPTISKANEQDEHELVDQFVIVAPPAVFEIRM